MKSEQIFETVNKIEPWVIFFTKAANFLSFAAGVVSKIIDLIVKVCEFLSKTIKLAKEKFCEEFKERIEKLLSDATTIRVVMAK
jgi:hypothetical protein